MLVEVTQEDIAHGVRGDCDSCPIARAVERAVLSLGLTSITVSVSAYYARVTRTMSLECKMPMAARLFVNRFDGNHGVEPFSFELPITRKQLACL